MAKVLPLNPPRVTPASPQPAAPGNGAAPAADQPPVDGAAPPGWSPKVKPRGTGAAAPAPPPQASAASPQTRAPDQVVARVGTLEVHESEIERSIDTMDTRQRMLEVLLQAAQQLGVSLNKGEDPQAFIARVRAAVVAKGLGQQLNDALTEVREEARGRALAQIVQLDVLRAEAAKHHLPLPQNDASAAVIKAVLERTVAPSVGAPVGSDKVKQAVEDLINDELLQALWAPHDDSLKKALGGFTDDAAASVKDYLTQLYGDRLGALAPERIAQELDAGGPASKVVTLIANTGKLHWTVGDLQSAAAADPTLKMFAPPPPAPGANQDPVEVASTPVTFQMADQGIQVSLGKPQPDPLLEQVKAGKARMEWVPGGAIVFRDPTGKELGKTEEVQAAVAVLRGPLEALGAQVADAWKAGKPLDAVIQQSGLAKYLGAKPADFVLQVPSVARALKSQVMNDALAGATAESLAARNAAVGLSADRAQELSLMQSQVKALGELSPVPFDLGLVLQGKSQRFSIPLTPGAKLTQDQRAAVSAIQHYLDIIGSKSGLKPTARYGEMDADTVARLQQLFQSKQIVSAEEIDAIAQANAGGRPGAKLDLTPDVMQQLVSAAAVALDGQQVMSGDLIFRHPVLGHIGASKVDPTRLVVEYMKAQGFRFSADPPKADADFFGALDASASRPVDENLLQIAKTAAERLGPYPPAARDALLTGNAFVTGGSMKVFIPGAPGTAADVRALAQRLVPLAQPMALHDVPKGERHQLPSNEPIAALKLVLAKLNGKPLPVNADGVIDGFFTGQELRDLRSMCHPDPGDGSPPSATVAAWSRVADAVDRGQVIIGTLNDTPGATPLEKDLNVVLSDLRQMAQSVAASTIPEEPSVTQSNNYPPLRSLPQPMVSAQSVMASHFGDALPPAGVRQGALVAEDLDRLQRLATELKKDGSPDAKDFVASFESQQADVQAVVAALRQGRLTFSLNRVQTSPRDGVLESKALAVGDLFLKGAEVLQSKARAKDQGVLPSLYRGGLDIYNHAFSLPGFSDGIVFNSVKDWTVVALKSEMLERGKAADPSVSLALRNALDHADIPSLQAVLQQQKGMTDEDKKALAAVIQSGDATTPDVPELLNRIKNSQLLSMTQVDADTLKYLVSEHGDQLGRSLANTLISGVPSPLPGNADARALLLKVASKMPPPWDSLNVTLQDTDPDVRVAKELVQEALTRIHGGTKLWGGLVPGRDVDAAKSLVKRLVAMDGSELAPYLKSFVIQQGYASVNEVDGISNPKINKATLAASVELAKKAVAIWSKHDQAIGDKMKEVQKTLEQALAKGTPVSLDDASSPVSKALKDLLGNTALVFGSTGGMDLIDFGAMLSNLPGDLQVRHVGGNTVSTAAPAADLNTLSTSMGKELPWTQDAQTSLSEWTHHVQFDPSRAVQTAVGSYVMFKHLMTTMIGYDLWVTPFIKSERALSSWGHAEWSLLTGSGGDAAKAQRSEALASLGSTWQDWADTWSSMLSYMYAPILPFGSELKNDLRQGRLDVLAGKALVYAPFIYAGVKGMTAVGGAIKRTAVNAVGRFTPRVPYEQVGPIGRTEAVALSETEASTSALYRGAVQTKRAIGTVGKRVLDPHQAWKDAAKGVNWAREQVGMRRVKLDATKGDFALKLPEETAQWVADHPNGRIQLTLLRQGKEYELDIANKDFIELGKLDPAKGVPKSMLERLGLNGRDAAPVSQALAQAAKGLPPPTAAAVGSVPTLSELNDPARRGATTTWRVEVNGQSETFELKNGTLADLADGYYRTGTYEKVLRKNGLLDKEPLVRAVLNNYRTAEVSALEFTARPVADVDRMLLSPEAYVGKADIAAGRQGLLLYKAESGGSLYRVIQRSDGRMQVMSGGTDISSTALGKKVLSSLDALKSKYGTTNAAQIAQLKQIQTQAEGYDAALKAEMDGWKRFDAKTQARPEFKAAHEAKLNAIKTQRTAWMEEVKGRFQTSLSEGELGTITGRAQLNFLKAKLSVGSLEMELKAGGLGDAAATLVKGTASTLGGQLKSPSFYLVLAIAGQQFLVNLGDTLNDDSLTAIEKTKKALADAAITAGGVLAASTAMSIISKLLPRAGAALSEVGTAVLVYQLASGQVADDIYKAYRHLKGDKNPLQAMAMWRALGVPEAGYMKIDADQHPQAHGLEKVAEFFGAGTPEVDDIGTLQKDVGNMPTPRLNYWASSPQSPMALRIKQLMGLPPDAKEVPIQRPQDIDLKKVKSYTEPVWETVDFLRRLPLLQSKDPILAQNSAAQGFNFLTWNQGVQAAARNIISWVQLDGTDGGRMLSVDPNALAQLLKQNDHYGNLSDAERRVLDRKLQSELDQVARWSAVLNQLGIDPAQKQAALVQLIENMASTHLANSICFEYVPKKNLQLKGNRSWLYSQIDAPPPDTNIDDYYTQVPALMRGNL